MMYSDCLHCVGTLGSLLVLHKAISWLPYQSDINVNLISTLFFLLTPIIKQRKDSDVKPLMLVLGALPAIAIGIGNAYPYTF